MLVQSDTVLPCDWLVRVVSVTFSTALWKTSASVLLTFYSLIHRYNLSSCGKHENLHAVLMFTTGGAHKLNEGRRVTMVRHSQGLKWH